MLILELLIIFIISYTFFGIIWGLATQSIGKSKGHQKCFWWGFFLGLIGLIVVVCLNPKTNNQNNLIDNIDALDKLQRLKENGAITEEEFEENKKMLLKRIESKEDKNYGKYTNSNIIKFIVTFVVIINSLYVIAKIITGNQFELIEVIYFFISLIIFISWLTFIIYPIFKKLKNENL